MARCARLRSRPLLDQVTLLYADLPLDCGPVCLSQRRHPNRFGYKSESSHHRSLRARAWSKASLPYLVHFLWVDSCLLIRYLELDSQPSRVHARLFKQCKHVILIQDAQDNKASLRSWPDRIHDAHDVEAKRHKLQASRQVHLQRELPSSWLDDGRESNDAIATTAIDIVIGIGLAAHDDPIGWWSWHRGVDANSIDNDGCWRSQVQWHTWWAVKATISLILFSLQL